VTRAPCTCGPHGICDTACPKRAAPKKRGSPEAAIQRAIIDRLRFLGVLAVHIPNEGKRSETTGRRMKADGMRPGWPDLACYQDGKHALLEVKRPGWDWAKPGTKTARREDNQRACHAELERQGFPVAVVRSQEEAIAALRAQGFRL